MKTLNHVAYVAPSGKPDNRDWTRELWCAAYAMARRMIHGPCPSRGWCSFLEHARRRFGASGWLIAQAAGRAAFDARTAVFPIADSVEVLIERGYLRRTAKPRPGNLVGVVVYRGARFERDRRYGLSMVWGYDPLAASNNPQVRRSVARQRRALREACEYDGKYARTSEYLRCFAS